MKACRLLGGSSPYTRADRTHLHMGTEASQVLHENPKPRAQFVYRKGIPRVLTSNKVFYRLLHWFGNVVIVMNELHVFQMSVS